MVTGPFGGATRHELTHVLRRDQHSPDCAGTRDNPAVDAELIERVARWTKAQMS